MSEQMCAAVIDSFGTPDALRLRQIDKPVTFPGGVLVRVIAAGVQLTDAAIRAGWTPPGAEVTFPQVLGNEFSGIVEQVGPEVHSFRIGDEVAGFNLLDCYAEFVVVPESHLVRKPAGVSWLAAGALSASGQTAHTALEDLAVGAGEVVLVCGAAGGVGSMFTQLAIHSGATVIGTASEENHDYLRALGAVPVAYGEGQTERIRAVSSQIDVVFDAAGHENLHTAIDLVDDRGRIATIVDMALAADLGCRIIRSRRSADRLADLMELVKRGELQVHIRGSYQLRDIADAHRDVESGHGRGKIVLDIGGRLEN